MKPTFLDIIARILVALSISLVIAGFFILARILQS